MDNIILVGFYGSGKSHVGRILSRTRRYALVDADSVVVERAGKSIEQIFADEGEAAFRALEREGHRRVVQRVGADYFRWWRGLCGLGKPPCHAGWRDGVLSPGKPGDHLPTATRPTTNRAQAARPLLAGPITPGPDTRVAGPTSRGLQAGAPLH